MGEVLPLYYGMEWLSDMSFNNVDFTSDSIFTIDAFHQAWVDVTEIGQIIFACRHLFTSQFTNSKVEFNRRQTNTTTILAFNSTILIAFLDKCY